MGDRAAQGVGDMTALIFILLLFSAAVVFLWAYIAIASAIFGRCRLVRHTRWFEAGAVVLFLALVLGVWAWVS